MNQCENFTSSPASAAGYSGASCSDTDASAPSRLSPTAAESSRLGSATESSSRSPSMTTSRPSTEEPGEGASMSSAAGSPASHGAPPENGKGQPTSATSGQRWPESSPRSARSTCSQKTFPWPHSANPGETFEGWATGSRQLSDLEAANWERCTIATDGGCSLPTIVANDMKGGPSHDPSGKRGRNLRRMLPTLTARDYRSGCASEETMERNSRPLTEVLGGLLHPDFADWYQGMPVGWSRGASASTLRAMLRFRRWLRRHSQYCCDGSRTREP